MAWPRIRSALQPLSEKAHEKACNRLANNFPSLDAAHALLIRFAYSPGSAYDDQEAKSDLSKMILVNVEASSGKLLDALVAISQGATYTPVSAAGDGGIWTWPGQPVRHSMQPPSFTKDWAIGGPLIGKDDLEFHQGASDKEWLARRTGEDGAITEAIGPDHLVSGMRCVVISRLGPEIEVPDELVPDWTEAVLTQMQAHPELARERG